MEWGGGRDSKMNNQIKWVVVYCSQWMLFAVVGAYEVGSKIKKKKTTFLLHLVCVHLSSEQQQFVSIFLSWISYMLSFFFASILMFLFLTFLPFLVFFSFFFCSFTIRIKLEEILSLKNYSVFYNRNR